MYCGPPRALLDAVAAVVGLGRFLRFYSLLALLSMPPLALSQGDPVASVGGAQSGGHVGIPVAHTASG